MSEEGHLEVDSRNGPDRPPFISGIPSREHRERRYGPGNAAGTSGILADEAVEARPPRSGIRFSKFLKRHIGPVLAASMLVLALIGGIAGTTFGLIWAQKARTPRRNAPTGNGWPSWTPLPSERKRSRPREPNKTAVYGHLASQQNRYTRCNRSHSLLDARVRGARPGPRCELRAAKVLPCDVPSSAACAGTGSDGKGRLHWWSE